MDLPPATIPQIVLMVMGGFGAGFVVGGVGHMWISKRPSLGVYELGVSFSEKDLKGLTKK